MKKAERKAELKALHETQLRRVIRNEMIDEIYNEYFMQCAGCDITKGGASHPHCDDRILHRPGKCWACDLYPERQALRVKFSIRYTGDDPLAMPVWPCPAEMARPAESLNHWYGNVARTQAEADEDHRRLEEELKAYVGHGKYRATF